MHIEFIVIAQEVGKNLGLIQHCYDLNTLPPDKCIKIIISVQLVGRQGHMGDIQEGSALMNGLMPS